ncbi:MAG: hypothetical protein RLZ14_1245 [Actinomycetota bacterium]
MSTLRKRDVEEMMARYDHDPVGALSAALRVVLQQPHADWSELLSAAGFTDRRRRSLDALEPQALDELLAELNELRGLTTVP